eukprot:TRINITY_DN20424_c0_g1_i1.p1 TRINITY_DN20424_c0_g1~~TRINITY_DN20424_c0_g1_i1.p1  ORF type:complete len:163 (-),score=35.54 TRINITY_DN20424_c0_g1_i1:11-499(-)
MRVSGVIILVVVFAAVLVSCGDGPKHIAYKKRVAKKFIDTKAAEEDTIQTESGLVYKVLVEGTGDSKPGKDDTVQVHYTGTLKDGTKFDSSVDRGQPATFGVSQVIAGWTEALQLMTVGTKLELYIPWDLAYGERGSPPTIPSFAPLVFEVELLEIVNKHDL